MAKMATDPRVWVALLPLLLMMGLSSGCEAEVRFKEMVRPLSLSFSVSYDSGRSQVNVLYSIPPPPSDKVYVLWAYDQGRKQVAKIGVVQSGVDQSAQGTAPFEVQGVVITEEDDPNGTKMVGTGVIELTLEDQNIAPRGSSKGGANGGGSSTGGTRNSSP
jgi:hypothetical protein